MNRISILEKVQQKIREQKIQPLPRWIFTLREDAFWMLCTLSIGAGGATIALLLFLVQLEEGDVYGILFWNPGMGALLISVPLLWIGLLMLLTSLTIWEVRHTKFGYRWSMRKLLGIIVGASICVGLVLHTTEWGGTFDAILQRNLPPYQRLRSLRQDMWNSPLEGFLAGTVERGLQQEIFLLRDFEGMLWHVDIQNAMPFPPSLLVPGNPIRALGRMRETGWWDARALRPWRPMSH